MNVKDKHNHIGRANDRQVFWMVQKVKEVGREASRGINNGWPVSLEMSGPPMYLANKELSGVAEATA